MTNALGARPRELVAATGFVIMWSSGFVGAQLSANEANPTTLLMWRSLIAAGLLGGWWLLTQRRRLRLVDVALQAGIGLLTQGVYLYGVFTSVANGVSAGTASLIDALEPIAVGALAGVVLSEPTRGRQWLGLAIGVAGVALVVSGDLHSDTSTPVWAYLLSVMSMAGLTAGTLLERKTRPATSLGDSLTIQCVTCAGLFSILGLATGTATPPATTGFWLAVAWVVGLSTIGGYGFYWLNIRMGGVTRVSSLIYLTPPTTMIWAFLMFGIRIDTLAWIGMAVCFVAVLIVRRAPTSPSTPTADVSHSAAALPVPNPILSRVPSGTATAARVDLATRSDNASSPSDCSPSTKREHDSF